MSFVDARFHISVRPSAEYKMPQVGAQVIAALLGDAKRDAVRRTLAALCVRGATAERAEPTPADGEALVALQSACANVCTHTAEYLRTISSEWCSHMDAMRRTADAEASRLNRRATEARRVRDLYAHRGKALVEREYRAELQRIANELEAVLSALRAREAPACARGAELQRSANALKEAFAAAHGTAKTAAILAIKRQFENELDEIQGEIARGFAEHAREVLE